MRQIKSARESSYGLIEAFVAVALQHPQRLKGAAPPAPTFRGESL
ncbi:MAG: hypothetical protein QMD73_02520 [Rhodocyclaceae bacterium]|nr:hypothetical protein [Rhodocyclaceae bacterium]